MNQQQAIKQFVEENLSFLMGYDFSRQQLKALQSQFFRHKHRNKLANPTTKDIILNLVKLLKSRGIQKENIKEYIDELPIFKEAGENFRDELLSYVGDEEQLPGLKQEDLETILKVNSFEAAKQIRSKEIETESRLSLQELTRDIEEKRAEYNSLPSILEQEPIPEPEFDPKSEDIKPWWERFYLKTDPFSRKDGLSDISVDLYEEVLVKTKPFQDTLSALNRDSNFLFHTGFLLVGDYGYGKTTFIDYLSYYLIHKDILPVRITCGKAYPDSAGFADNFYLRLRNELRRELIKMSQDNLDFLLDLDIEEQIIELSKRMTTGRRQGIVVFLDDYHKHRSHFPQIYEFLGLLQILKDNLTRAALNVGFVVSGITAWKAELLTNGQMSGFLDNTPIEMPNITPDLVCEVFNQRIAAFCYDRSPRKLRVEFVKRIFKDIEGRAGYRDYLNRIISELSNNNFSIIDTPIEIDEAVLGRIKAELESDPTLRGSFNKLVYSSKFQKFTQEQIAKCLELLIQTCIQDGIGEFDKLFQDSKFYFQQLRDTGLIQKSRVATTSGVRSLKWVIRSTLQKAVDAIRKKHQLGINDYLLKIYGWKGKDHKSPAIEGEASPELLEARKFFSREDLKIPRSAIDNITLALRTFDSVLLAEPTGKQVPENIDRGFQAFGYLSAAFFEVDSSQSFFRHSGISSLEHQWQLHWFDDEGILELFKRVGDYKAERNTLKYNLALKQLKDVFPAVAEQLVTIIQDQCFDGAGGLVSRNVCHAAEELKIFEDVRQAYFSSNRASHFNYVKRITDYLETRMRMFLYATTLLIFGEKYIEFMPQAVQKYAYKSLSSRTNYALFNNAYNGLTRPQFREIFVDGNKIKELVIDHIGCGWTSTDWRRFFETFIEENIATSHQQVDAYTPLERTRYLNYCRMAEEFTAAVNKTVHGIINSESFLIAAGDDRSSPENYIFKYSFKPGVRRGSDNSTEIMAEIPIALSKASPTEHTLQAHAYEKVVNTLLNKVESESPKCVIEDLLDVEYITSNYNVNYLEFVHSLVYAKVVDRRLTVIPWFGSSVLIRRS
jgi:hypothetical protein